MKLLGIGSRINHAEYGKGVVTNVSSKEYWVTFIDGGLETIAINSEFEVIEAAENEVDTISFYDVEQSLLSILKKWNGLGEPVAIGDKWKGGNMKLEPGQAGLAHKDVPIDVFFHKIVMLRDRLRVMEQKINASNLEEIEKVELQQYITRIYGSLTTFNVLFKLQSDYFVGEKTK
ncbi:hypothetical protein [Flavobacterium wongokense]|uniref:hypothetical protein n=1 Tax=Flavobacterium wongokense TaxID=2910674 RepID=UPI001F23E78C|nr:hypothetical protein [Flavobacterium sp. WG47]MCF6131890.1 hypothetical protein [Flavobacterium sp. WG47]